MIKNILASKSVVGYGWRLGGLTAKGQDRAFEEMRNL